MKLKEKFPAVHLTLLFLAMALVVAGCKKQPPPVTDTPEPPKVEQRTAPPPAEPIKEEPMKAVQDKPAPARSMSADEASRLLKAIYFDFDRYEIRPDQTAALKANADVLKGQLSNWKLVIEGHCDERGTNEYNMALGDRRANAARQYLIDMGVSPVRIRTISFGEERPADPSHGEEAWAKNRRGEFIVEEG